MNRRLRMLRLDELDDRRRILDTFVIWRDDQRHQRKLGELLILALGVQTARNPSMRNSLVTEVGTDLHRVRRQFDAVNVVFVAHRIVLLRQTARLI
jgi:hypothetical protein